MRMVIQIFHPKILLARLQLLSYLGIFRCPKPSPKARQCISDAYFNQRILHGIVKLHHAPRLTPKNNQPHTVGFRNFHNRQVSPRIWCNRPVPSQNRAKPCRIHWVQLRENYLLEDIWIAGNHQATEKWHPSSTFLMGRVVLGPRKIYQNCCKRTCDLILAHGGSLAQPYAGCEICGNLNIIQNYMVYTFSVATCLWLSSPQQTALVLPVKQKGGSFIQFRGWEACSSDHNPFVAMHSPCIFHNIIITAYYYYCTIGCRCSCLTVWLSLFLFYFLVTRFVFNDFSSGPACRALNPRRKTKTTVEAFQIWPVQGLGGESHSRISYKTIWIKGVLQVKECTSKVKTSNHMCAQA